MKLDLTTFDNKEDKGQRPH